MIGVSSVIQVKPDVGRESPNSSSDGNDPRA